MKVRVPKVKIDIECYQKIVNWVNMANAEISGMGIIEETKEGFLVTEVFLPKQTNTSSNTDLDQADLGKLFFELSQREEESYHEKLKFWWHSHYNFDVFWSGTDETCIESIGGDRYLISSVFNQKGDIRTRIDGFSPFRFTLDELPLEIDYSSKSEALKKECKELFDRNVKENKIVGYTHYGNHDYSRHTPGKGYSYKRDGNKVTKTHDHSKSSVTVYKREEPKRIYGSEKYLDKDHDLANSHLSVLSQVDLEEISKKEEERMADDFQSMYNKQYFGGYE